MLCPFHFLHSLWVRMAWPVGLVGATHHVLTQGRCAAQVSDLHVALEIKSSHLCCFKGLRMLGLSLSWDWPEGNLQETGAKLKLWKAQCKQIQTDSRWTPRSCPQGRGKLRVTAHHLPVEHPLYAQSHKKQHYAAKLVSDEKWTQRGCILPSLTF